MHNILYPVYGLLPPPPAPPAVSPPPGQTIGGGVDGAKAAAGVGGEAENTN